MRLGQFSIRDAVWFMLVAALLTFCLLTWMRLRPVTDAVTEGQITWTNPQTQESYVSFPKGTVENGRISSSTIPMKLQYPRASFK